MNLSGVNISLIHGDALRIKADTLVLKYAQAVYGLDREVVTKFERLGKPIANKLPDIGKSFLTDSYKITNTNSVMFLGVANLRNFQYKEIREFGKSALIALRDSDPSVKTVLMTIHGPGYGLDECEAFESQLGGILESINKGDIPRSLSEIIFVEQSLGRVTRLRIVLESLFPISHNGKEIKQLDEASSEVLNNAGDNSVYKKRVFVAMPFASEFDDCFHYGIQGAVKSCGYLCERADLESFVGDVMEFVKERIQIADLIIADLTTANPNVYLEVGYAWGLNKKTVLLVKDTKELTFDTRGQRCLAYTTIKDLETKLTKELTNLKL